MKFIDNIKQDFRKKTPEQVFSFCLFIGCFALMFFCAIVRLCGGLWFSADLSQIEEPSAFWQEVIMALLFVFEAIFVYKILCRTKWIWCFLMSVAQLLLVFLSKNIIIDNIINLSAYFIVPFIFKRKWITLLESLILYVLVIIYAFIFLYGRIGVIGEVQTHNFIFNVLGSFDYKLFFVSFYLFIKNFGGIKLWKIRILT